jgi:hypothetical protein
MQVTKAVKNVVHQIDGRPAFDVYKDHAAKRGTKLAPESAGSFLIGNELGIYFFDKLHRARAPLAVGADGSLTCASSTASRTAWSPRRAARPRMRAGAWGAVRLPRFCSSTAFAAA